MGDCGSWLIKLLKYTFSVLSPAGAEYGGGGEFAGIS